MWLKEVYRCSENEGLNDPNAQVYMAKISECLGTVEHIKENKYILDYLDYGTYENSTIFERCKDNHAKVLLVSLINIQNFREKYINKNVYDMYFGFIEDELSKSLPK